MRAVSAEPDPELRKRPALLLLLATRPAFLSLTAIGVAVGWASALHDGAAWQTGTALTTLLFALLAHAGANVINDFHDIASDNGNTERLYPFTGGSRFIQTGLLSAHATRKFGTLLLLAVIPGGLWLVHASNGGLIWIGLCGLVLAWAYSAPPLRLSARGLGELAIAAGWALVVIGSDYVLRGGLSPAPVVIGISFGLLVAAVLFINQFPDAGADAAAGKVTLVVRLGRAHAAQLYPAWPVAAATLLALGTNMDVVSRSAAIALLAIVPVMRGWQILIGWVRGQGDLRLAIRLTLLMAYGFGLLMVLALLYRID